MKKYIPILKRAQLFYGVDDSEINSMLSCLDAKMKKYAKGEYIYRQTDNINNLAVLVEGELHIQKVDYWGNSTIISRIGVGDMFGESYASTDDASLLNDAVAIKDSTVIFFDVSRIIRVCSNACRFHTKIVENLFFILSHKNRELMQKISHISRRTTREKLISYLSEESRRQNNSSFKIPFNRQQLADYLSVDRSAMSNELCKMRDEGLLNFEKSHFELLFPTSELL